MDHAAAEPASGTYRLIYRSHSLIPEQRRIEQLGELFSTARSNNKRAGVTGALLLTRNSFVQTLEGDERTVQALFARIKTDLRHDSVEVLESGPVAGRVFARWAMARIADQDGEADIPLIAHADGISPAAPRGDGTPSRAS
jgi:hypothetical protein